MFYLMRRIIYPSYRVVTYVSRIIKGFAIGIKMESSNQCLFEGWSRDQGDLWIVSFPDCIFCTNDPSHNPSTCDTQVTAS